MPTVVETIKKINSFTKLPQGWHFGEGAPPSVGIIEDALALHLELIRAGFVRTNTFPGVDGQIMVTAYRGAFYLEFSLELNGSVTYVFEVGKKEQDYREGLSLAEAQNIIRESVDTLWDTFAFFTIPTSTLKGRMSKVTHLETPQMVAEFPLWTKSVPSGEVMVFVLTSNAFTPFKPIPLHSFGGLKMAQSLVNADSFKRTARQAMSATSTLKDYLMEKRKESLKPSSQIAFEFA